MKPYWPQTSFPDLANLNSSLKVNDLPLSAIPLLPKLLGFDNLKSFSYLISQKQFPSPNLLQLADNYSTLPPPCTHKYKHSYYRFKNKHFIHKILIKKDQVTESQHQLNLKQ